MRIFWQKNFLLTLFFVVAIFTCGCTDEAGGAKRTDVSFKDAYGANDTWAVYWYLCGTDLESNYGSATADMLELLDVKLPPNVKVIIQAGGTTNWQNNAFQSGAVNRYVYDADGLKEIAVLSDADMGSAETLADFLRYGNENIAADHKVFVFWNHGGGSAAGVCFDERTGRSLKLNDITQAFSSVYSASVENPPFELIGFDACLMASYDTAKSLYGFTKYMTASEEVEPGNGWLYSGWLDALAKNPAMSGAGLGKAICDSYIDGCDAAGTSAAATLSVIDMQKLPALQSAYEAFGVEALRRAAKNPAPFFSAFGRKAKAAENYGGNTREQGYANMVDIGDLAKETAALLPDSSQRLVAAANDAVIYRVQGAYRTDGIGISGFYTYNGDEANLLEYISQDAVPLPYKYLYYYLVYGEKLPGADDLIKGTAAKEEKIAAPATKKNLFDITSLEDLAVNVDTDGNAFVTLTGAQTEMLSGIRCNLIYMSLENDLLLYLGSDADIIADWESGIFKDNFRGVWPMLDGHPVYVEITDEEDEYNLYSVPILINGEKYNLQVSYSFADEKYEILGARKEIGANGMGDRNLVQLKKGDKVTTLHYAMSISGDDDEFRQYEVDTFTVGDNVRFADEELGNGDYAYCFEFVTPTDASANSDMVTFSIANGKIVTSVE